jgi:hypothetical protein
MEGRELAHQILDLRFGAIIRTLNEVNIWNILYTYTSLPLKAI